jgi:eukaryotic-like serine/threonine-protein kinase
MSLGPGTRIGPYEIVSAIGGGGMGEVYRATDTNLGRQVAIKVLPEAFAQDPDRVARFEREAKTLAALNHPNIAQIYGLEKSQGTYALVMELVEGEDLSERIARGPIPLDETLPIAKQIAEALEAAHEQGIIHRDLKPANIKVRPDGTVKVLDFGLAKLAETSARGSNPSISLSPTITSPALMSGVGVLLGTAAYMSPEQAKGKPADKRSDLWAFGCVLYEMLTGKRTFDGDDIVDVLGAIARLEPDWSAFPADIPLPVTTLIRQCLTKDRRQRLGDMSAAMFVFENVATLAGSPPAQLRDLRPSTTWLRSSAIALTAAAVAVVVTIAVQRTVITRGDSQVTRFTVEAPPNTSLIGAMGIPRFAVAPDGRSVVMAAGPSGKGPYQLWVRRFDAVDPQPLPKTASENGNAVQGMFWFPDGSTIGYFDEVASKLKTVDLRGQSVRTIIDVPPSQYGGSANAGGTILYSSARTGGVFRINASGGTAQQVTSTRNGELAHLWPSFLPDGQHFIYLIEAKAKDDWALCVGSLNDKRTTILTRASGMGTFAPPDQILFARGDSLFTQRIDLKTFALVGDAAIVAQPMPVTIAGRAGFSVSNTGVLVHVAETGLGSAVGHAPTWIDRTGHLEPLGAPIHGYTHVQLSPDGTRAVFSAAGDLWIWSFARKSLTRLTFGPWEDSYPVWTDSNRIAYMANPTGPFNLYSVAADGTGMPAPLFESAATQRPSSVSPDGMELMIEEDTPTNGIDIRAISLRERHDIRTVIGERVNQRNATISPDSRWIAYQSNDSGIYEVFVRPYPQVGNGRWQVSTNGGQEPLWSRDGKELFYVSPDSRLMSVRVDTGTTWSAASPIALFADDALGAASSGNVVASAGHSYDVSLDGKRFLLLKPITAGASDETGRLTVVVNWFQELKQRQPAK